MKSKFAAFVSILMISIFILSPAAQAKISDYKLMRVYTWGEKLKRGAVNIVTSPVEIARQIHVTSNEKDLLTGWTLGLAVGVGKGVLRFGAGVLDLLTFPFDFPDTRKAPLLEPEFVWQKPGAEYA